MTKTLMIIGLVLVWVLAYFGLKNANKPYPENSPLYSPNITWRVSKPLPCPPFCEENKQNEKMVADLVQRSETDQDKRVLAKKIIVVSETDRAAIQAALHEQLKAEK